MSPINSASNQMAIDFSIATPFEKFSRFTTGFTHNPTTAGCITEIQMEYPEGKSYSVSMTNEYKKNYHSAIVPLMLILAFWHSPCLYSITQVCVFHI
jgi:hypothetical protein